MTWSADDLDLLPRPRRIDLTGESARTGSVRAISAPGLPPQGYRITIDDDGVRIDAADAAGEFYARATLSQLKKVCGRTLPCGTIEDHPDIPVRGVMLDISRDKVPTLKTLKDLVVRLASLKVNHLQLYMEHTFAYSRHREVWDEASPMTADEIRELDAHCRAHHVELSANQNCLGHMERWLKHDRYRPLAIRPEGWEDRRGRIRPPTTIDPGKPESAELIAELLAELLPCFSSPRVHVGLDEPWELPDERYDDYLQWIRTVRSMEAMNHREMLMWGDIVARHPESAGSLPDGVTICEWGYEASHPFDDRCRVLAEAGRPFWVCPGTSSWNTLVGRSTNARHNCRGAAQAAVRFGAGGYLVTDWGDNGHLQYLPASELMFAYAAAVSWCADANVSIELARACDAHVFDDGTGELSRAFLALGDAHKTVTPQLPNSSTLVLPILQPNVRMGEGFTAGITHDELDDVRSVLDLTMRRLDAAKPGRADGSLIVGEMRCAAALLDLLCRDAQARLAAGGRLEDVSESVRRVFAEQLDIITERHRDLWLERNRPGGLDDSAARLTRLSEVYRSPGDTT